MNLNIFYGILIPFIGTSIGAACVFFMKNTLSDKIQRALTGFAAGVMVAASVWSLIIPAIEQSASMGKLSFLPAAIGFWIGILFLLLLDHIIPHLHQNSNQAEGPKSKLQRTTMMVLAVTLHNIPEGMAVGVVYAGYLRQHNHHRRRCTGIIPWHRYPEFSGRRHHIHAPSRRRYEERQSLCGRCPLRYRGTCRRHFDNSGCPLYSSGPALSAEFRRRRYALCCRGRADPRNVPGTPL